MKADAFISREIFEEYKRLYPYPEKGDVLISAVGSVGRTAEYTGEDAYFQDSNVVWLKTDNSIDKKYLKVFYQVIRWLIEGSTVKHLYNDNILKSEIISPTLFDEQRKIGKFFDDLDHLITLHQRKYLQKKKTSLTWEQRKLGDVAEFSKGSGYSKGDLVEYGTPIILYGRLYTNYETRISDVDTFVDAKVGSVYSKGGEVIVPASGETAEDIARAATVDKSGILLGGDLNIVMPNKDINSSFLAISISSGNPQRELAKKAQGKSVVHIHNEEIKNLVLPFPIKDEQNKIASYFCQLDNLITLHRRAHFHRRRRTYK